VTISFRIVKNSEPISLAEGSFAFMRLVLQQPVRRSSLGYTASVLAPTEN